MTGGIGQYPDLFLSEWMVYPAGTQARVKMLDQPPFVVHSAWSAPITPTMVRGTGGGSRVPAAVGASVSAPPIFRQVGGTGPAARPLPHSALSVPRTYRNS